MCEVLYADAQLPLESQEGLKRVDVHVLAAYVDARPRISRRVETHV